MFNSHHDCRLHIPSEQVISNIIRTLFYPFSWDCYYRYLLKR